MEFLSDTGDRESPIDVLDEDKHDQYPFEIRHDQEVDVLEGQEIRPDIPEDIRMLLTWQERIYISFYLYLRKWRGIEGRSSPAMTPPWQIVISSLLAFLGIFVLSSAEYWILPDLNQENLIILTGAYAATAVLVYEAYLSPLAQPRNVIGGYILSSLVGVTTRITLQTVGVGNWITAGAAVAFALMIMNFTKTVHPPGGACALIAVIGGDEIVKMEFNYVLVSAIASMLMVLVALVGNNIIPGRQYPTYWW